MLACSIYGHNYYYLSTYSQTKGLILHAMNNGLHVHKYMAANLCYLGEFKNLHASQLYGGISMGGSDFERVGGGGGQDS